MVCSTNFAQIADWLNSYVVKNHPQKEQLSVEWLTFEDPMAARTAWNLTSIRVIKDPEVLNLSE